ncbi:MAG: hypothetical protein ACREAA_15735 [Candidatus Polarisedimenticolia bacterium]
MQPGRSAAPLRHLAGAALGSLAGLAGASLGAALEICARLERHGLRTSLRYRSAPSEPPARMLSACLAALDALSSREGSRLVMKAPALQGDDALLERLAVRARSTGTRLHFDPIDPKTADIAFSCIKHAARAGTMTGTTLPALWRRSLDDAGRAVRFAVPVRVVKGRSDGSDLRHDTRGAFLALIDRLAGRASLVTVGTHDPALAIESLQRLKARGTPCEIDLRHGLPHCGMVRLAERMSVPVSVIVPFGLGWLPHTVSQLAHNPRLLWTAMRDLMGACLLLVQ